MLTFTHREPDPYKKMELMVSIKNYLTKLILNTGSDNIKYYSNIELGEDFLTPHLHCQLFYTDLDQVLKIRDKVLYKFGLLLQYSHTTMPTLSNSSYNYVIKDYSASLDDIELLLLDGMKKKYRDKLDKNIRFSSHSKEKYTKAIYKNAYSKGILKGDVDYLIDNRIVDKSINIISSDLIYAYKILFLVIYRINGLDSDEIECYRCANNPRYHQLTFEWWTYGKLWIDSEYLNNKNYKGSEYENVNVLFTG